jgi:hypothetical protein
MHVPLLPSTEQMIQLAEVATVAQGAPLARLPVVVGEFGVYDHGSFYSPGPDYTNIRGVDVTFLNDFGDYLKQKETQGATISWFWWAWNANSGGCLLDSITDCEA